MADILTVADLESAKQDDTFHAEVITGKLGGNGADIDFATHARTGQAQKTLPKILDDLDWSYVGLFADGVTFTDKTDFAVDAVGTQWIYTGSLPFSATAGTVPSEPAYQVVHVKSHAILSDLNPADGSAHNANDIKDETNNGTVQDFINTAKTYTDFSYTQATIAERLTTKTFTTEQIKSMSDGESFVNINGGSSILQFLRLTVPVDNTKDLVFLIDADIDTPLLSSTSSSSFFLVGAACDDVVRTNASIKSLAAVELIGDKYKLTVPLSNLTSTHFSLDLRLNIGANGSGEFRSMSAYQDGIKIGDSLFNLIRSSEEWNADARNTSFAEPAGSFLSGQQLDRSISYLQASNVLNISRYGKASYLVKHSSLKFYNDVVRLESSPVLVKTLAIQKGDYYPYREEFPINITKNLALVAVGGKVNIRCSDILTPVFVSTSGGIDYYTATYDADRHYDNGVRTGTTQPKFGIELVDSAESVAKYQLTATASAALVQATANRAWFDFSTNTVHFSYPAGYTVPTIHACNSSNGVNEYNPLGTTSSFNIFAFNVFVYGASNNNWAIFPDNYVKYPLPSSKFMSLHSCGGIASGIGEGFRVDNLDHELIDCNFSCNGNDGFNHHFVGRSYILGGRAWNNSQDGNSHHEQQIGYVDGLSMRYNGAGNATPAFGADVYYKNCESVCASDGLSTKVYSGTMCVLSGSQGDAIAYYDNCYSDHSLDPSVTPRHYMSVTLDAGSVASLYIKEPSFNDSDNLDYVANGDGSNVIERV